MGELYLEAEIVETRRVFIGKLGELKVVGGDDAAYGELRNGLKKHPRTIQLVEGVGALENLVEDDKCAWSRLHVVEQLAEP